MRVFVLCTGRCGSSTLIMACRHITNYTSGHESHKRLYGPARWEYPDAHIEADQRMAWMLGRLAEVERRDDLYVWLRRDREAVAQSMARRQNERSIPRSYYYSILQRVAPDADYLGVCRDMVHTIEANICDYLRTRRYQLIELESAKVGFARLWERIGAQGDYNSALAELDVVHDRSEP